jgi:two-component sensor histidine kinase
MTLALLPIGLVAVLQTRSVDAETSRNSRLTLLALTERSVLSERLVIERAMGVSDFLSVHAENIIDDTETCIQFMRDLVAEEAKFSLISLIPDSGMMTCSSSGKPFDVSKSKSFQATISLRRPRITVNMTGPISGESVIIISHPFKRNGEYAGLASISVPHRQLATDPTISSGDGFIDLITFNSTGDILTSKGGIATAASRLPKTRQLIDLIGAKDDTFIEENASGLKRIYAFVPIEDGSLYALGIWDPVEGFAAPALNQFPPGFFPILMWIVSLLVAYLATHRLVSRHVQSLRQQMRQFGQNRTFEIAATEGSMPAEIAEIRSTFHEMASKIADDQHKLEEAVRVKNVLIKEIHHRVKNNLQLISSIISMQIRKSPDNRARRDLGRVQDRVLNLATIHKNLYNPEVSELINAGDLLRDVIFKSTSLEPLLANDQLTVSTDLDDIQLTPDQAVPLSLYTAEVAANIASVASKDDTQDITYHATFKRLPDGRSALTKTITTTEAICADPSSVAEQLMHAFASQLEAEFSTYFEAGENILTLTFKPETTRHKRIDY